MEEQEMDAYHSERRYQQIRDNMTEYLKDPQDRNIYWGTKKDGTAKKARLGRAKFRIKNPKNLQHMEEVLDSLEGEEISKIRLNRYFSALMLVADSTEKEFPELTQKDFKKILKIANNTNKTIEARRTFCKLIKKAWKTISPEVDTQGRPDADLPSYPTKVLKVNTKNTKNEQTRTRIRMDELKTRVNALEDSQDRAFLMLLFDALIRPQELINVKYGQVKAKDGYVTISVVDNYKEEPGQTWSDKAYPYVVDVLQQHPTKRKDDYLFVNRRYPEKKYSLPRINKILRQQTKSLGMTHRTLYDFNRSGISQLLVEGAKPIVIQKKRRWSSLKQLKTYDLTQNEEIMEAELKEKGIIKNQAATEEALKSIECPYCRSVNGLTNQYCSTCKRPLDPRVVDEMAKNETILQEEIYKRITAVEQQLRGGPQGPL